MADKPWIWTAKGEEAQRILAFNKIAMLEGGSRSTKTSHIIRCLYIRAVKYPEYDQAIFRLRLSHARASLWYQTLPKVARQMGLIGGEGGDNIHFNKSEFFIEFPKHNKIWLGGLDDKERTEKILGQEHMTIFLNEVSQMTYDSVEMTLPRLLAGDKVKTHLWMDQNPPTKAHWTYKMFHLCQCGHSDKEHKDDKCVKCECKHFQRVMPDGTKVPENDFKTFRMNPADFVDIIGTDYLDTLDLLGQKKKKRFKEGEYGEDSEGALWKRSWFKYKDIALDKLKFTVTAVDPSGSKEGDEIGIITAGFDGKDFYILDDYSMHGTPNEWGEDVTSAYDKWRCNYVVAEKNFGGDMVESVITDMGRKKIKVELVTASKGKAVRADPISALYEKASNDKYTGPKVYHRTAFPSLEDELVTWEPMGDDKSPNRLDALVFAITRLSEGGKLSLADVL